MRLPDGPPCVYWQYAPFPNGSGKDTTPSARRALHIPIAPWYPFRVILLRTRPAPTALSLALAFLCSVTLLVPGCATRRLPPYEKPIRKSEFQTVRTTAYTHTEDDHRKHGNRTAMGTALKYGELRSAAADWSRWPAGTVFRILPDPELYVVEDYGWALAGTNTIDLYKPSKAAMRAWGVRRVTIQVLHWGDPRESRRILEPRKKHRHVRRMLKDL